jgi:hypothetical protein
MQSVSAEEWYQLGKAAEKDGDLTTAVGHYKKAERLGHSLTDPVPVTQWPQVSLKEEVEIRPGLSQEERERLAEHPHVFDYQFTADQLAFLEENGYLVIPNAVPKELCDQMTQELYERAEHLMGVSRSDPSTWSEINPIGFIDVWHGEAYNQIRQHPVLYSIFAQILKTHRVVVGLDRANLNPPAYVTDPATGKVIRSFNSRRDAVFPVHTDMNLWDLKAGWWQGGLALQDCHAGGFHCIPGFHKLEKIRKYREDCEQGKFGPLDAPAQYFNWFHDERLIDTQAKRVPMKQGDFVIWSSRLPHSALANTSDKWRVHAYVRHLPIDEFQDYAEDVRQCTETGRKPLTYAAGGPTGEARSEWEVPLHKVPEMSWLGRRVFGFEPWD